MTAQTDHRENIGASWERRLTDMRGLVTLAGAQDAGDLTDDAHAVLADNGYEIDGDNLVGGDQCGDDFRTAADEITASYALSVETYYTRDDETHTYEPARVEMALTLGGPTVIVTYDVRGSGWSSYSHSWGKLGDDLDADDRTGWEMTGSEHDDVRDFLAAFYVPELA